MLTSGKLDATGHRWPAPLGAFDFTIAYRPGTKNAYADGLSRRPRETSSEFQVVVTSVRKALRQYRQIDFIPAEKAQDYFIPLAEACAMGQGAVPSDIAASLDTVIPSVSKKEWAEYQGKDPVISSVTLFYKVM